MDGRTAADDLVFMAEAMRFAGQLPRRPWPNPPVGAVVVCGGRIVGRGAHQGPGTAHAEVLALEEAGRQAVGATLYCTLEPCNHQGHTPPCAPRVAASGVQRVVVGIADPNPRVRGGGMGVLREAGLSVTLGRLASEALELVWPFAATCAFERPFVVLKTATSLDGRFAAVSADGPRYLTGIDARQDVHRLRRWCDAVLVGERTMEADRPSLDGRLVVGDAPCPREDPVPAYADGDLSWEGGEPDRPYWVFASRARATLDRRREVEHGGGRVVLCDDRDGHLAPESIVQEFASRGGHCLMVEGGPALAGSFLASGLVDRWVSYVAPVVLGAGATWPARPQANLPAALPARFQVTRVTSCGADVKVVADRASFADLLARLTADERRPG